MDAEVEGGVRGVPVAGTPLSSPGRSCPCLAAPALRRSKRKSSHSFTPKELGLRKRAERWGATQAPVSSSVKSRGSPQPQDGGIAWSCYLSDRSYSGVAVSVTGAQPARPRACLAFGAARPSLSPICDGSSVCLRLSRPHRGPLWASRALAAPRVCFPCQPISSLSGERAA